MYIVGTSVEYLHVVFSTKSPSLSTHLFHLCVRRCLLSTALSALFVHAVSTRPRPPNGVLGVLPSGGPRNESQRVLNRDGRRG